MLVREFYNKVADAYDSRFRSFTMELCRRKERELFERYARGRVLDLGCGTGHWTGQCFAGIDCSEEMLKVARKGSKNLMMGDICNLPIRKNSFDSAVLFFSVIERRNFKKAVQEISSVLKKGGTFIISLLSVFDNGYSYREKRRLKNLPNSKVYHVAGKKGILDLFTIEEVRKMFRERGFEFKHFDSLFILHKPMWGSWEPLSIEEKIRMRLERLFPKRFGCTYFFVFKKK